MTDPRALPMIEAEHAALKEELKRLSALLMSRGMTPQQEQMLRIAVYNQSQIMRAMATIITDDFWQKELRKRANQIDNYIVQTDQQALAQKLDKPGDKP